MREQCLSERFETSFRHRKRRQLPPGTTKRQKYEAWLALLLQQPSFHCRSPSPPGQHSPDQGRRFARVALIEAPERRASWLTATAAQLPSNPVEDLSLFLPHQSCDTRVRQPARSRL